MPTTLAAARRGGAQSVGFNLGAIALGIGLVGLAIAYALDGAGRAAQNHEVLDGEVTRTIGGLELTIPRAWLRADAERSEGFAQEVELEVTLPLGIGGQPEVIDVSLVPRSRARPSSALLDGVYLHQFQPGELSGPPGLVGKPLTPTEGYQGETVWYDALSSAPFVAKCLAPVVDEGSPRCIRTVFYDDVAAVYAFDANVLDMWRQFDPQMDAALGAIGVK